jgi:hypothetical protein
MAPFALANDDGDDGGDDGGDHDGGDDWDVERRRQRRRWQQRRRRRRWHHWGTKTHRSARLDDDADVGVCVPAQHRQVSGHTRRLGQRGTHEGWGSRAHTKAGTAGHTRRLGQRGTHEGWGSRAHTKAGAAGTHEGWGSGHTGCRIGQMTTPTRGIHGTWNSTPPRCACDARTRSAGSTAHSTQKEGRQGRTQGLQCRQRPLQWRCARCERKTWGEWGRRGKRGLRGEAARPHAAQ